MAADSTTNSSLVALSISQQRRGMTSPWTQIVRGGELESVLESATGHHSSSLSSSSAAAASIVVLEKSGVIDSISYQNNNNSTFGSKKSAWNKPKPLNGVVEGNSVMGGADNWPALSESTRPTSRSDAVKPNSDGSASTSQGPIIVQTLQRPIITNANSSVNPGLAGPRSTRHRGSPSGSVPVHVGYTKPPPPPPLPPVFPAMGLPTYSIVTPILDTQVREVRGVRPQSGHDQPHRNSPRRNNFGPRPRANGQHYHNNIGNIGGRRDEGRNANRSHQFIPPGSYIPPPPPPPGAASFIAPNMRPLMNPMGFVFVPTMAPEPFRGMPLIPQAPPAPMYFPTVDLYLPNRIIRQIDFYFSDANLATDKFLKAKMDEEGWVPINVIANFRRVQHLTTDVQLILESLKASLVVEVKGDKLRRRNDWKIWSPSGSQTSADSASHPPAVLPSNDNLATSVEKMCLNVENTSTRDSEDTVDSHEDKVADTSLPAESNPNPEVLMDREQLTDEEVHPNQI